MNSAFNLRKTISESRIRVDKITAIEESKDNDKIPLTKLIGNLQTYELRLIRIGKSSKSKSMALMANSSDIDESLDVEDSKMKSYITRQFKKFMKNANAKGFDKDRKQSSSSQFKSQDKVLRVLGLRSHEIRVSHVSQDYWEEQGTCCYVERH